MKKAILLIYFFCSLSFFSCSNNNDSPIDEWFIGEWTLVELQSFGETVALSNCMMTSTVSFNADHTYNMTNATDNLDTCIIYSDKGTWEKQGTNTLIFNATTETSPSFVAKIIKESFGQYLVLYPENDFQLPTRIYKRL